MRFLFDTNVLLDVLLDRQPHAKIAVPLLVAVEEGRLRGLLGATTVTTLHYLAAKAVGAAQARRHIRTLLSMFEVAPVTQEVLAGALELGFPDFEDAVLHEAARRAQADGIVTRDLRGFRRAVLRIYAPADLLRSIRALER